MTRRFLLETFAVTVYCKTILQAFAAVSIGSWFGQRKDRIIMIALLCVGHSALDTIYSVAEIPTKPIKVLATGVSSRAAEWRPTQVLPRAVWAERPPIAARRQ